MSLVTESPEPSEDIRNIPSNSSPKYSDFKDLDNLTPSGFHEIIANFAGAHCDESLNADLLVMQREKLMEQHQLKKVVDYYGATLKEGEMPIIQRPPLDDLTIWRNSSSGLTIGVLDAEGNRQLENKSDWCKATSCTIYLSGSIIPDDVLNPPPLFSSVLNVSSIVSGGPISNERTRNVPSSNYDFNFKTAADIIKSFEVGNDILLPGFQWSKTSGNWDTKADGNFLNFLKYYLFIYHNKESVNLDTPLEKKRWRDWTTAFYKHQSSDKTFKYLAEAIRLLNETSLTNYYCSI